MILKSDTSDLGVQVDLTPIIDMVFLLLIFFLVATTFQQSEREMKIALPESSAAGPISTALREIVVNIDDRGGVTVGGQAMTDAALAAMVRSAVTANAQQKVSVRGDRSTLYANVARVLDLCKGAGVTEPYLETTPGAGTDALPQ